ncbi:MAG TPA: DUF1648 domain-containing protein [Verrucomicrobiota bacterium]|nr:DUF1648 domain-containing protein [Verrucomicrobiota bacterium]HNU51723.1 DUF1648 domain-containing protein [Verrucomicrobiota bacterium]
MNRLLVQAVVWAVLILGAVGDLVWHYPRLPERVASHFNAAGQADGWCTRSEYLATWLWSLGLVAVLIPVLQWLMKVIPARFINMPRRHYWLAPEREAATREAMSAWVFWLGVAMWVTMALLHHLTLRVNLGPERDLGSWPLVIVGANLAAMAVLIIGMYRRFR